jgi:hypothetical protein
LRRGERRAPERCARTDDYFRYGGADFEDVQRLARREPKSLSLADRKAMHTGMRAKALAVAIDDRPGTL